MAGLLLLIYMENSGYFLSYPETPFPDGKFRQFRLFSPDSDLDYRGETILAKAGKITMTKELKEYMNPYWAGFGLGLVLLFAYLLVGRGLGASGAFASFVSWISPAPFTSTRQR